jgi:uncharacterized damage-inducible protein DinB
MEELAELHRFNAWANRNLLDAVRRLEPAGLSEQRNGMYDTIERVLTHMALVEIAYLYLIRGKRYEPGRPVTLEQAERALAEAGPGLIEEARSRPPEHRVRIPWFERDFPVAVCLRQVLTHSANHRADINQWLPHFGIESVEVDYINLALEE